jgi:hypothetical protein
METVPSFHGKHEVHIYLLIIYRFQTALLVLKTGFLVVDFPKEASLRILINRTREWTTALTPD